MECLGLHNKPKAEVHLGHKLTGPKEEEEEEIHLHVSMYLHHRRGVLTLRFTEVKCGSTYDT
jgi:hypothetical protein